MIKTIAPYILLHYLILILGIGIAKYIIHINAFAVIAIIAAPAITSFVFVKRKNRLLIKKEALALIAFGGTPVFFLFSSITGPEFSEPYIGWLLRFTVLIFGALLGYGICSIYYLAEKMWLKYIKA